MARETCPAMLMITSSPAPNSASSVTSVCRLSCRMLPKPSIQLIEPHSAGLVEVRQEQKRIEIVELQPVAVDSQERCRHGHRNPLVSINERVVLREALPESSRLLNQVTVIPAAGSSQGRLDRK